MRFDLSSLFNGESERSKKVCGNAMVTFASGYSIESFEFDNDYDDEDDWDDESHDDISTLANFVGVY